MIPVAYLIDTISCATSGTEKQLIEIIKRLDKDKFQPYLICLYESTWMQTNHLPCTTVVLGYRGLLKPNIIQVVHRLITIIRDNEIKLLQTFFEDSIFVAWLATRMLGKRVVLLSSRRDMGLGDGNYPWYHRLFGLILPLVNRNFDGIAANSNQVREYVARRETVSRKKIEVIYNGVELPMPGNKIPPVFTDNPADCWLVIVASLNPVKRHDVLIRAIAQLKDIAENRESKVLVLGTGSLEAELRELTRREGVENLFYFQGAVHNVSDYLYNCNIGILCSDREGLSNAILEYMACGLPVIATAVGGNTELVEPDTGICVPPNDSKALAQALGELIVDEQKRKQLGRAARAKVEKHFSWHRSMYHLETYYQHKLKEKGIFDA